MFACSSAVVRRRWSLPIAGSLALVLGGPALGQGGGRGAPVPVVKPGKEHVFTARDGVLGSSEVSTVPMAAPASVVLGTNLGPGVPLSSFVCANERLSRATAEIWRFNVFTVDGTWDSETVIEGRVTGTVEVRGFLFLIGVGQAKAEVVCELLDVTDPSNPRVVNAKALSKHELISSLMTSVAFDMTVEAGAGNVGGGLGIAAGSAVQFQLKRISDSIDFSMDVWLRRGHTYRLIVKNESEALLTAAGTGLESVAGKAAAVFYDPFALAPNGFVPNLLDKQFDRLQAIGTTVQNMLPLDSPVPADVASLGWAGPIPSQLSSDNSELVNELLVPEQLVIKRPGMGMTIRDLMVEQFVGLPSSVSMSDLADRFFELDNRSLVEEQISTPGVNTTRLMVSLEQDQIELAERRQIETNLERCDPSLEDILPAEAPAGVDPAQWSGGKLEKVFHLVAQRILDARNAGLPLRQLAQAQSKYDAALQAKTARNYARAHRLLCQSYDRLLMRDGDDDDDDDHGHDD